MTLEFLPIAHRCLSGYAQHNTTMTVQKVIEMGAGNGSSLFVLVRFLDSYFHEAI